MPVTMESDARSSFEPLFGRDQDLAAVVEALESRRFVSLTGPGGSGKTRLAEAVVGSTRAAGRHALFIDASDLRDPELLCPAIAAALRLDAGGSSDDVLDAVAAALEERGALLAVDNLEQLPGAGAVLAALLTRAPGIRVLATSRVKLGAAGETEFSVPALALPRTDDPAAIEASPAGALFLARARAIGRLSTLDPPTAVAVAALLRRLDGLPLAIELAAARTRIIKPAEILYWLDQRGVAAVDPAGRDAHRSLRDILAWTIGLLSADQARVLGAVSVCAGFDLRLAQALLPDLDVMDPIVSLVSLGLVREAGEVDGSSRFRLLETIRADVWRRLPDDELATHRDRHAGSMVAIAATHQSRLDSREQPLALERMDAELDNMRLALEWLDASAPLRSLELWRLLDRVWRTPYRLREGMGRFEHTAQLAPEPTIELSRAMSKYVGRAFDLHGSVWAKDLNLRSLALARRVADRPSEVEALGGIAMIAVAEHDHASARAAADEATAISASIGDPNSRMYAAQARCFVMMAMFGASSDEMRDSLRETLDAALQAGELTMELNTRGNLAVLHLYRGEYEAVIEHAARAVELARGIRNLMLNWCLSSLATALAETGQVERAIEALVEAARDVAVLAVPERITDVLGAAAAIALAAGDPLLAARMRGTIDAMLAGIGGGQAEDLQMLDRLMARVRQRARELDVELAIRNGRAADPLEVLSTLPATLASLAVAGDRPTRLRHGDLTRREVEILALLGEGKSDPEIAAALFISPKTASVHVANIKAKLGLQSRLEMALRARDLGLVDGASIA
jgi:predicted ATPase/DNA-binding NarL/FixJ family response regulator